MILHARSRLWKARNTDLGVDLTGQLWNPSRSLRAMLGRETAPDCRARTTRQGGHPGQRQVRLSTADKAELVERVRAGAFKKELARAYGVHVETVRAIIAWVPVGEECH